jgi:methylenetetrahydrofolate dehydrogenase (NADP+) / methenyltetrahydrofolate cyclohydrolase
MKYLNGQDVAEFVKERHIYEVRRLRQSVKVIPKLVVIVTVDNPVIEKYMKYKQAYAADINAELEICRVKMSELEETIKRLNLDDTVSGVILQLPLADPDQTEKFVNLVAPEKDVDGLGQNPAHDPATPKAILWLLAGYNIELKGMNVLVVGEGRLVGKPLVKMLKDSNLEPKVITEQNSSELTAELEKSDIVITATGRPYVIDETMLHAGQVVVDAGVASEDGRLVGDVAESVYASDLDIKITPRIGGVGPLTVAALFENLLIAAGKSVIPN